MSKLNDLLKQQAALTAEANVTGAFLDRVTGKGTLTMTAKGPEGQDGIVFTPTDLGLELKVLAPIEAYYVDLSARLDKVNSKVAAIELLVG